MISLIIVWIIIFVFLVLWCVIVKNKRKKEAKIKNNKSVYKDQTNVVVDKVKKQMSDISLGTFGRFFKDNIDIENLVRGLNYKKVSIEQQPRIIIKVCVLVIKISILMLFNADILLIFVRQDILFIIPYQYIINIFMSYPLIGIELDECWDDWCFSEEQKKLSEEELNVLREQKEKQIQTEIKKYLDKNNPKDIAELYKKFLPYLNYNDFIKTIKLEYLNLDVDKFTIQLSDENQDLLCAAYLVFDRNLKDYDWHNF